jgi:hypothetical protein
LAQLDQVAAVTVRLSTRILSATEWPAIAAGFRDLSFEQSLSYAQAAASRIGARTEFVVVERAGQPVAAVVARIKTLPLLGRGIAWLPSGPLVLPGDAAPPDAEALGEIFTALRQHFVQDAGHILRFRLSGLAWYDPEMVKTVAAAAGFAPSLRAPAYHSIAIDLSLDADTVMMQFSGSWRRQLRYGFKSELTLEQGNSPELQARFLALFRTVQTTKGFAPDISPEFHFDLSGPDYPLDILIATKDGQDTAGIVIGTSGCNAVYLFGATAAAGRDLRAGYFLAWEGVALMRARGHSYYDLGGIDHTANPDVGRFKDGTNGRAILAHPYEARPVGVIAALIGGLETLHARLKRR